MERPDRFRQRIRSALLWAVVFSWMAFIYSFSAQDGEQSASLSGGLIRACLSLFHPGFDHLPAAEMAALVDSWQFFVRKAAHFSVYLVLGVFAALAADSHPLPHPGKWLLPAGICLLYAGLDEWHQGFVPGRSPQLRDVGIDFAGAAVGIVLAMGVLALVRRRAVSAKA